MNYPNELDDPGVSSLFKALKQPDFTSDFNKVRDLLEQGVNPNSFGRTGWTALGIACFFGRLNIVQLLVQFGANVNLPGVGGMTPLMLASRRGHVHVVQWLLLENNDAASAADPNLQDESGATALMEATTSLLGHVAVVHVLLQNGADPNIPNTAGDGMMTTVLHYCATHNTEQHAEILQALLDRGANTGLADWNNKTALELACENNNVNAIFLLLQHSIGCCHPPLH